MNNPNNMEVYLQRLVNEIAEHLVDNGNRTLKEEYELIQQKKSKLSRRLRDFVVMMVETEVVQDEEVTQNEEN